MSFLRSEYAWLFLLVLLPAIIYIYQFFLAKTVELPSLIFFQEATRGRLLLKKQWLRYLLQTLVLFFLFAAVTGLNFNQERSSYRCYIDDRAHPRLNKDTFNSIQNEYGQLCREGFYSLSDLSLNQKKTVSLNRLHRNQPYELFNLVERSLERNNRNKKPMLIFLHPDRYTKNLNNLPQDKVYFASIENKNNKPFSMLLSAQLKLNPLDYRKRRLIIRGNLHAAGKTVLIERNSLQTQTRLDENAASNTEIEIDNNKSLEKITVKLKDSQPDFENIIYLVAQKRQPYRASFRGPDIPETVAAVLNQNNEALRWFWFNNSARRTIFFEAAAPGVTMQANTIYFLSSTRNRPRYITGHSPVFQRYPFDVTSGWVEDRPVEIIKRFTDGTAAVVKTADGSGFFLFDPDSTSDYLKKNPALPLFLLSTFLDITNEKGIVAINTEAEASQYGLLDSSEPFRPSIKNKDGKTFVLNYHPEVLKTEPGQIPEERIVNVAKKNIVKIEIIYLAASFLLMLLLVWFDLRPSSKTG